MNDPFPFRFWKKVQDGYQIRLSRHFCQRRVALKNSVPLISFTFDDFPISAWRVGGAILASRNFRGTYYTSMGLMESDAPVGKIFSREDLESVVNAGHELGCHTFSHCHSWNTSSDDFEKSITENQRSLHGVLPKATFKTLSYPLSCPRPQTKRRAAKHFSCCRGGGQTFNVGTMDLNSLNAFFLEKAKDNPSLIKSMIEENARVGGWLIFATHDVCENPTRFGCTPKLFEEIVDQAAKSGAKILPVGEAVEIALGN